MNLPSSAPDVYVVDRAEVAALFRKPLEVKRLLMFLHPQGLTVSDFAQVSGLTLNAAYRKVQRLESEGLIRQMGVNRRAGRDQKVYGCPFHTFFVPARFTSVYEMISDVFQPMQEGMNRSFEAAMAASRNPVGGMLFTVNERGLWLLPATPDGQRWRPLRNGDPVVVNDSGPLYLSYEDAQALAGELRELFDRYRQKQGGKLYMLHQMLTPMPLREDFTFPHAGYTELI